MALNEVEHAPDEVASQPLPSTDDKLLAESIKENQVSAKATPSDDDVLDGVAALRLQEPELGIKKVLDKLKLENNWQLSLDRLKKLSPDPLYKVVPIEGKGLGVRASKAIRKGQRVIYEKPICVAHRAFAEMAYGTLSDEHKKIYDSLAASGPGTNEKERIFQCESIRKLSFFHSKYIKATRTILWDPELPSTPLFLD